MTYSPSPFGVGCVGLLTALWVLLFTPTPGLTQDPRTIDILKHIIQLEKATGSYRADCRSVTESDGTAFVTDTQVVAKWPNMSRSETRSPEDGSLLGVFVSNGEVEWVYLPMLNTAFKSNLEALHADAQGKYGISANYIDEGTVRYLGKEQLGTEKTHVFEGTPSALIKKREPAHPAKVRVYISAMDGTIRKVAFYDKRGKETYAETCGNVRKDASISVEDFEFIPPEGTRVIEVSDVGN